MIGIIDYGSGNIAALENIFKKQRIPYLTSSDPDVLTRADRFILPGVGAFDPTIQELRRNGLDRFLSSEVGDGGKLLLGICVGMHLLANGSEEGKSRGLGLIDGIVERIDEQLIDAPPKLPHMGWNSIKVVSPCSLFDGVNLERGFYFLHSFHFVVEQSGDLLSTVDFAGGVACAVGSNNILGVQFHPEKSHSNGVRLLTNFSNLNDG